MYYVIYNMNNVSFRDPISNKHTMYICRAIYCNYKIDINL